MGFFGVPSVCKRKSNGNLFLFLDGAKTKMPTLRGAPKRHQNPQDGDESKTGGTHMNSHWGILMKSQVITHSCERHALTLSTQGRNISPQANGMNYFQK